MSQILRRAREAGEAEPPGQEAAEAPSTALVLHSQLSTSTPADASAV